VENLRHLPSGLRTTGLVEITLSDGTKGLGEGYLAVFAPGVFRAIVELISPLLIGRDASDLDGRVRDIVTATAYWSQQGAARHVISAVEIALHDCAARRAGLPLWKWLGGERAQAMPAYASGGDSVGPAAMEKELLAVEAHGIRTFKIRARANQANKVVWTQRRAAPAGISIAVDMTQNLVVPSQTLGQVVDFVDEVAEASATALAFVEEALGPDRLDELPELRHRSSVPIAGGEIVTTAQDLVARVHAGSYDIVQPDATVIGGIGPVLEVFRASASAGIKTYVHCWGGAVGVLANYHAAAAAGGEMVEWPLPGYPLRSELLAPLVTLRDGHVTLTTAPGLGLELTPEIEQAYAFREDAVYDCLPGTAPIPQDWP
jgi:L-alanine-DL-glutamate epimerase-like enolase superfamily enzyme